MLSIDAQIMSIEKLPLKSYFTAIIYDEMSNNPPSFKMLFSYLFFIRVTVEHLPFGLVTKLLGSFLLYMEYAIQKLNGVVITIAEAAASRTKHLELIVLCERI